MEFKLLANTPMGLERIVADEIEELGYSTTLENGRVYFNGDKQAIIKTNLMLRTADRIRLIVGDFKADTFDDLFEMTKSLPWSDILGENANFPVTGRSQKSTLYSVPDVQRIVKKAIVEHLKDAYNVPGRIIEDGPRFKVDVNILKDRAIISLDTSGDALHKRGYRLGQGDAPIKETLAASMLHIAKYNGNNTLLDPFVGSGTIAIEAAMMAINMAPGLNREFDAEFWPLYEAKAWDDMRMQLDDEVDYDKEVSIIARDIEPRMIEIARKNAEEIGIDTYIDFSVLDVHDLEIEEENVQIVTNPPYGERIGEAKAVEEMYRKVGELMKEHPTLNVYIMTSNKEFEQIVGKKATKRRKLFNGYIETTFYQYWGKLLK